MDICRNCGGAIMQPGVAYGWAGKTCHCPVHPSRQYQDPMSRPLDLTRLVDTHFGAACNCIGPQNGQPLCPCQMRGVTIQNGRYVRVTDLGPAP